MPVDLTALVDPAHTAVVTQELQGGVVGRDGVAGVPPAYADAVIDNTLALLATLTTVDDVLACWPGRRTGPG